MAETLQEMILRKKKEKEEGTGVVKAVNTPDNKAALANLKTDVSTAKTGADVVGNDPNKLMGSRATVDMQSESTKKVDVEGPSIGQQLLDQKKKRAAAAKYIEDHK